MVLLKFKILKAKHHSRKAVILTGFSCKLFIHVIYVLNWQHRSSRREEGNSNQSNHFYCTNQPHLSLLPPMFVWLLINI